MTNSHNPSTSKSFSSVASNIWNSLPNCRNLSGSIPWLFWGWLCDVICQSKSMLTDWYASRRRLCPALRLLLISGVEWPEFLVRSNQSYNGIIDLRDTQPRHGVPSITEGGRKYHSRPCLQKALDRVSCPQITHRFRKFVRGLIGGCFVASCRIRFYTNVSHLLNPRVTTCANDHMIGLSPSAKSIIPEFTYYSNAL